MSCAALAAQDAEGKADYFWGRAQQKSWASADWDDQEGEEHHKPTAAIRHGVAKHLKFSGVETRTPERNRHKTTRRIPGNG